MKIYEKPLAKIEKILVEDVITASEPTTTDVINSELSNNAAITNIVDPTNQQETVIVFEW